MDRYSAEQPKAAHEDSIHDALADLSRHASEIVSLAFDIDARLTEAPSEKMAERPERYGVTGRARTVEADLTVARDVLERVKARIGSPPAGETIGHVVTPRVGGGVR